MLRINNMGWNTVKMKLIKLNKTMNNKLDSKQTNSSSRHYWIDIRTDIKNIKFFENSNIDIHLLHTRNYKSHKLLWYPRIT